MSEFWKKISNAIIINILQIKARVMNYLQPANRKQLTLMNSLDDLISENNIVRIIDLIIDQIVKSNPDKFIKQRQTEVGRPG